MTRQREAHWRTSLPVVNQGDALFHIAKVHNTTKAEKVVAQFHEEIQEEMDLETLSYEEEHV